MVTIRNAQEKDSERIIDLLKQVLELHAEIRPDIFISGTTKYTKDEIVNIIKDKHRRAFVAEDDSGEVLGYALCIIKEQPFSNNMVPFTTLYIDDLCVDSKARGRHIGAQLFDYVKKEAKKSGCYEITLNVWEGNDAAKAFYDKMGMKPKETQMELILKE